MANLGNTIINGALRVNGKINSSDVISAPSFVGALTGNADTATKLKTARTINGTSFDGSGNITTANWGTARNIGIVNSDGTGTAVTVSVNGSGNINLKLPDTIKAALTGNASTASSAAKLTTARTINGTNFDGSGNITTANWGTARNVGIVNSDGTGTAVTVSVNGSGNVNLKLPATIKASLTGNAATATKATQDGSGNVINTTYIKGLSVSGRTITYTKGDGTTGTITTQDSDTTYSAGEGLTLSGTTFSVGKRWTAVTQGQKWSRICYIKANTNIVGISGILSIGCTRGNVVCNYTFMINASHAQKVSITQLNGTKFSSVRIRGVADNNGSTYIELYDTAQSIKSGTAQSWYCSWIPILQSTITTYTAFTDGSTVPENHTVGSDFTTVADRAIVSSTFYGALSGNAATATKLATARTIGVSGVTGTAQSFDGTANIVIPITAVPSTLLTNKSAIKGSEITNDKHWVPSSDASVINFVSMTAEEYATNASSLATGTIVAITDGVEGYVTTQATSLTCELPLDL